MLVMAASRCDPIVRAEGSLKVAPEAPEAPAGEGVAGGAFDVERVEEAGAGGGAAGVDGVVLLAGVWGGFAAAEEDAATGATLGC